MGYMIIIRAIGVRMLFSVHGVISIWRLTLATTETRYWYLGLALILMLFEMTVTLVKKQGKEWKWFCPSVFIYLLCIVPTIWFLELHELDRRISSAKSNNTNKTQEGLTAHLGSIGGVKFELRIPIELSSDEWIRTLEQLLLLILILGRWFLPKGKLTHDQLSQLLLVYIGTAADIVEFFEAFKEKEVNENRLLCIVILGIWSFSLIQFCLVLTASRVRRDRTGLYAGRKAREQGAICCNPDVYGIIISICLQDLPFLVLRMLLIFKYKILSHTNLFFTCKNTIVIILLIYRLIVVQIERRRAAESEETMAYMLPKYNSSPNIFVTMNNPPDRGRRTVKVPDTLSMTNSTSHSLSTCSTRGSVTPGQRSRLDVEGVRPLNMNNKPYGSCNNIYDVRATASTRPNRSPYNMVRNLDELHSPL